MAVKFSFMFFFKKLIGRLPTLTIYWWIIFAYNVIVLGYGASVYYVVCPYSGGDPRGFLAIPIAVPRFLALSDSLLDHHHNRPCLGIVYADTVDNIWESTGRLLSAEVGIIMAAAISFRASSSREVTVRSRTCLPRNRLGNSSNSRTSTGSEGGRTGTLIPLIRWARKRRVSPASQGIYDGSANFHGQSWKVFRQY
ncbi:hypothetical protein EJ07DRAFT_160596 [Lizonia empirigonia]|nr:hypothetical protein EJ07DRAFT_160596 [Lizonia empirigonia]